MAQVAKGFAVRQKPRVCPESLKAGFMIALSFVLNTVRANQELGCSGFPESGCFSNAETVAKALDLSYTLVWSDVEHLLRLNHWLS